MLYIYTICFIFFFTSSSLANREPEDEKYYITALSGPHWSSKFYSEQDVEFKQGYLSNFSFGIDLGFKISKRWFFDAYFYHLPTTINESNSGLNFSSSDSIKYTNNIHGIRLGYITKGGPTYRLGCIAGLISHNIGGLERISRNEMRISKFRHFGLTTGIRLEKKITSSWAFDSDLAYILPLNLNQSESFSGKLWYRGLLGIKKRINKNLRIVFEYQAVYHNSSLTFNSENSSTMARSEFFIQSLMIGVKYRFTKILIEDEW